MQYQKDNFNLDHYLMKDSNSIQPLEKDNTSYNRLFNQLIDWIPLNTSLETETVNPSSLIIKEGTPELEWDLLETTFSPMSMAVPTPGTSPDSGPSTPSNKIQYLSAKESQLFHDKRFTIAKSIQGKRVGQRNKIDIIPDDKIILNKLPSMNIFRTCNGLTISNFLKNGEQPADGAYNYEATKESIINSYTPRVFRYLKSNEKLKSTRSRQVVAREGLCPYCVSNNPDLLFHDINSSRYSTHLLNYHGIFTNGTKILDPVKHCHGREMKKNGTERVVECVVCPYPNCKAIIKFGRKRIGATQQQRFSAYIRHASLTHKQRKNIKHSH